MIRALGRLLLLAAVAPASAAPPPVVPWQEAGAYVGRIVSVEGEVVDARTAGGACVLEFAPSEPRAFRAVLVLPLLSSAPRRPERLYGGRRVRVTGRVQRFQGRPEIVLRSPEGIELLDAEEDAGAGEPPPPHPPDAGAPAALVAQASPCELARARWREHAAVVAARAAALGRCLERTAYRCRDEGGALLPALAALEASEARVAERCP